MWITFLDGQIREAVIFSQNNQTLRVATEQSEDLLDLTCISGQWVTENCEPVQVEFAWDRRRPAAAITMEECICPPAVYRAIEALWDAASQNGRCFAAAA